MPHNKTGSIIVCIMLSTLITLGSGSLFAASQTQQITRAKDPTLPWLTLHSNALATGPQLALWQAIEQGRILQRCNVRVKLWKTLNELEKNLLAGDADLWIGHTDIFVGAATKGAPVQLLLTTAWRKFYLVSSDRNALHFNDFIGKNLAVSPPGSPAVPILKSLGNGKLSDISFTFEPPQRVLKKLITGKISAALLPEPLVTKALTANPRLMVGENVAELYARQTGQQRGMPIAGIAVHQKTAKKYPEIIRWIADETMRQAKTLAREPHQGITNFPNEFQQVMPRNLIEKSLTRERLDAAYSHAIRPEIMEYTRRISSACDKPQTALPKNLFWKQ